MHFAKIFCFYLSATSAVKHYGMAPSEELQALITGHAQKCLDSDLSLVMFTTDNHQTHDGIDFLSSEMGIFNQTIFDFLTPAEVVEISLDTRSPVKGKM
ncbi:hypothetical protein N7457_008014 [Penicillium paradoxum]|uniref:uncharacterized protein n=1 Tax=Penicillium paradoxum TaxID=176176 RepID=UPI00254678C7|nr:uncharacterized protein N7457_008014 [Penicillium paradoxum]KAJ5773118.1 hypothetical protein N7457_008014 [Penicillium paradoxum]